jgi:hypothetical protein
MGRAAHERHADRRAQHRRDHRSELLLDAREPLPHARDERVGHLLF